MPFKFISLSPILSGMLTVSAWKYVTIFNLNKAKWTHICNRIFLSYQCPKMTTTPLWQWGFWQCLNFSCTTLKGKYCWHPIAIMGVVDTLRPSFHCHCIPWFHLLRTFLLTFCHKGNKNKSNSFYSPTSSLYSLERNIRILDALHCRCIP